MTKKVEAAIEVVDRVCASTNGTRNDHIMFQEAMMIIRVALVDGELQTTLEKTEDNKELQRTADEEAIKLEQKKKEPVEPPRSPDMKEVG